MERGIDPDCLFVGVIFRDCTDYILSVADRGYTRYRTLHDIDGVPSNKFNINDDMVVAERLSNWILTVVIMA